MKLKIILSVCLSFWIHLVYSQNIWGPNGFVGIGTTNPFFSFQVQKNNTNPAIMIGGGHAGSPRLQVYGLDADAQAWMGLGADMSGDAPYEHSIYFPTGPGHAPGRLTFGDFNGSQFNTRMVLLQNGNLGIGSINPEEKLTVNGRSYMADNLKIMAKDGAWVEGIAIVKPSGWGGIRFVRNDPSSQDFNGNWAVGYNAGTGNDFSISNYLNSSQNDFLFHINASTLNVGIGTSSPSEKLSVNGKIAAKEIQVRADGWPDYVFDEKYNLPTIDQIEEYIKGNGHLADIPSADIVKMNGIELGEMNKLLLKKIEELTLYIIDLNKKVNDLHSKVK